MSPCHNVIQFCIHDWYYTIAAFPVLAATPPVFDRLRVANMEGEGLGNLIVWLSTQLSYVVTPLLIMQPSDVQYVWDRSCILCLATKMGQVPAESYTGAWIISRLKAMTPKGCWVTSMKIPSSDAIILWSKRMALFGVSLLYHSCSSVVKLQTRICFTGKTYLSSGSCFGSLASL